MSSQVQIVSTGLICPIGNGAPQCSASFRTGISAYRESPVIGRTGEPLKLALVPEGDLEPLDASLDRGALTDRERRMLRLGGMALHQIAAALDRPLPLFLALPEPRAARESWDARRLVSALSAQSQLPFDAQASQCFELGRASGFFALEAALAALAAGADRVVVGGVDTHLDLSLLAALDAERRLLGADVKDGFVPGEGAAFLLLARPRKAAPSDATSLCAVGTARDPGHRYSDQPALGTGLATALDNLRAKQPAVRSVRTCMAGLNGEHFQGKGWGVARLRHRDMFDSELAFEHPADCFGDVGAATGPLLIALADELMRRGHRRGPALVWATSDREPVGAAYLAAAEDS